MGEIADSIIDGECCQSCGEYIGEATGYPRYCSGCKPKKKQFVKKMMNTNELAYYSLPKRP